ncbi:MAG: Ald Xan dh protein [Chloroflexi bacterium]|nr:Ald Xan dh protein [Chloroflexota bacterium]
MLTEDAARIFEAPEYRIEGPLKVSGRARYTADVKVPDALIAKFLLSPLPHAHIVSIDTSAAKAVPGVKAVLTGADIGLKLFGRVLYDWPVLAVDQVRFAGERVAAVAAETREAADDAIKLIQVEYEDLPSVFDAEEALRDGAPLLHPDPSGYFYGMGKRGDRPNLNLQGYELVKKGEEDIERVFASAHRVFEDEYSGPRQHQGYIEPHACVLWIDGDDVVHVYSVAKAPFGLRTQLSRVTGHPSPKIVVDSMFIGGDFGGKGNVIDEFPCYYLARATGRPIRSINTYAEELAAGAPRHAVKFYLRTGVDRDGRIIAHQSRAYFNGGAYGAAKPMPNCLVPAGVGPLEVYNVPNTRIETFVSYTNTVPCGHMRAPGSIYAGHAGEGHIDHIARELGMDPVEFRLLNCVRDGDRGPANEGFHKPKAVEVLEAVKRETSWGRPLLPNHGRGVVLRHRHVGTGKSEIVLRLLKGGKIEALYATPDQGSGSATVVRRVAAAVLSVDPERIEVRYGDTGEARLDGGSGASRVTHVVGQATIAGATSLKEQLQDLAAEVMGWPAGKVRLEGDRFVVADGSGEGGDFADVAGRIAAGGEVEAIGAYDSNTLSHDEADFNFYAYMIEVEVDPDTGRVEILDAVQVVDVGTIINPVAHQGQLDGSFVFGFGNAMMEELVEQDGLITTLSLGEYKLPTQMDIPPLRTVLVQDPVGCGPFGAKAAGEITNSGVAAAVANAITDAVGVRMKTLPLTAERVFASLQEQKGGVI